MKREYRFTVAKLDDYETRQTLEAVFKNPDKLRPGITRAEKSQGNTERFEKPSRELFAAMQLGDVALENIEWFNGGLQRAPTMMTSGWFMVLSSHPGQGVEPR